MGLRFRKSIKIAPGLKLNFGMTGVSLTAGVPGFHRTVHSSGRVTTSVGIPGTGISYVDIQTPKKQHSNANQIYDTGEYIPTGEVANPVHFENDTNKPYKVPDYEYVTYEQANVKNSIRQLTSEDINSIYTISDEFIDWTDVLVYSEPQEKGYDIEKWKYHHSIAKEIINGNIDAYLDLIYHDRPLDDLLDFGSEFQFGTDDSKFLEVEFSTNDDALQMLRRNNSTSEYEEIYKNYVCAISLRIAKDLFALLPVRNVIVTAMHDGKEVAKADFSRDKFYKANFRDNAFELFKWLGGSLLKQ